MAENKLVYSFRKNSLEMVEINLKTFNGKECISIWVFINSGDEDDNYIPAKGKGISMLASRLPELKKGIDLAHKEWKKRKS